MSLICCGVVACGTTVDDVVDDPLLKLSTKIGRLSLKAPFILSRLQKNVREWLFGHVSFVE